MAVIPDSALAHAVALARASATSRSKRIRAHADAVLAAVEGHPIPEPEIPEHEGE